MTTWTIPVPRAESPEAPVTPDAPEEDAPEQPDSVPPQETPEETPGEPPAIGEPPLPDEAVARV